MKLSTPIIKLLRILTFHLYSHSTNKLGGSAIVLLLIDEFWWCCSLFSTFFALDWSAGTRPISCVCPVPWQCPRLMAGRFFVLQSESHLMKTLPKQVYHDLLPTTKQVAPKSIADSYFIKASTTTNFLINKSLVNHFLQNVNLLNFDMFPF